MPQFNDVLISKTQRLMRERAASRQSDSKALLASLGEIHAAYLRYLKNRELPDEVKQCMIEVFEHGWRSIDCALGNIELTWRRERDANGKDETQDEAD